MPAIMKKISVIAVILALAIGLGAESRGLRFLQSIAVPGLSQVRNGHGYGYAMLGAEAGIISTMLLLNAEKNLKMQEYHEYALKFAHISNESHPDQYYRDLSRYNSSGFEAGGYNAGVRQDAIALYPGDPAQQQAYIDANMYPDDLAWSWDSSQNRADYSKIRVRTQDLRDYGKMAVGVLIANHLISGVNALLSKQDIPESQVYFDIKGKSPMLMLNVQW